MNLLDTTALVVLAHNHWDSGWGVLAILGMVVMMGGMGVMMWMMMRGMGGHRGGAPDDPVDVLKARYARGEITTEEFEERMRALHSRDSSG